MTTRIHYSELSSSTKLSLGLGYFAMFIASQGIASLAVPFYQMTLAIDPFLLSLAITIPSLIAVSLGPAVGHWSDNISHRFGRRRPFIFAGSLIAGITFGLIWMVPTDWGHSAQLGYFAVLSLLFNIGLVVLTVPLTSLAYEVTTEYHSRTQVMGLTSLFIKFGSVVYHWFFPLAQLAIFGSVMVGIIYVGWSVGIIFIALLGCLPVLFIKEPKRFTARQNRISLSRSIATLKNNGNLRILVWLLLLQMCGGAFVATMDYYLLVYYMYDGLEQGAYWKAILSSGYAVFGLLAIPVVNWLAKGNGKIGALKRLYLLTALGGMVKWFIFTPDIGYLLLLDALLCSAIWTAMTMLIPAMFADVCDQDELEHKRRREGEIASVQTIVITFCGALALLLSGFSLNLIQFDASAVIQSDNSIFLMRVILAIGTVLFSVLPLLLLKKYQLDEAKVKSIQYQLGIK